MRKFLLLTSAAVATMLSCNNSIAADGTITFTGNVTASACTTVVGATQSGGTHATTATVALPNISVVSLNSTAGSLAGHTAFSIKLQGCQATASLSNVRALFSTSTTAPGNSHIMGNIEPAASAATDVGVVILSPTSTQIDLNGGTNFDPGATLPTTTGDITLNYQAAYKSLSTGVTAGGVKSVADYVISYF